MKHVITHHVLGCTTQIEISPGEFNDARRAKDNLVHALYLEEKFNYIVENYLEFEVELLKGAAESMVSFLPDWNSSIYKLHTISRRMVNLLTTCRAYLDQLEHHLSVIYGKPSDPLTNLKAKKSAEYDSNFSYQFMESLRNYVQHRHLPVHGFSNPGSWVDTAAGRFRRHSLYPTLDLEELRKDKKFKSSLVELANERGKKLDLKPLLLEYMESIGRVHLELRNQLKSDIDLWEKVLLSMLERYKDEEGQDTKYIDIVEFDEEGICVEEVHFFDDLIHRRKELETKNRSIDNYSSQFVTGETVSKYS